MWFYLIYADPDLHRPYISKYKDATQTIPNKLRILEDCGKFHERKQTLACFE